LDAVAEASYGEGDLMLYIVKGFFTMAVEANAAPEAKHTAERILRGEGVKAIALDAMENKNGKRGGVK
jgi:hypothetical protein